MRGAQRAGDARGPAARLRRPVPRPHRRRARRRARAEGRPVSIRFRTPDEGRSTFTDVIRGEVSVEWSTISDFVIVRSNGTPVFFLANAVDDLDMGITHVLRGEDLIDSTHRVLALRRALGHDDQPVYAHLPLILGPGGGEAVEAPRRGVGRGVPRRGLPAGRAAQLPRAARLGSRGRPRDPDARRARRRVRPRAGQHVGRDVRPEEARVDERRAHPGAAAARARRRRCCRSPATRYGDRLDIPRFEAAVELAQVRATTLVQIADQMAFLFTADDELEIDPASWEKVVGVERAAEILDAVIAFVETLRVDRRDRPAAGDRGARRQAGQGHARRLHGDRGPQPGPAAVRLDRHARPRLGASTVCGLPAPGCEAARSRSRCASRSRCSRRVRVPLASCSCRCGWRRAATTPGRPTRSSCSAPRSSTAVRRRSSRRGSTTRSISTGAASRRSSS